MSIWIVNYEENEIRIEAGSLLFTNSYKLFVNNKLQDEKLNNWSFNNLTGHLISKDGKNLSIKVNVGNGCRLFVDDEKIEVTKVKTKPLG